MNIIPANSARPTLSSTLEAGQTGLHPCVWSESIAQLLILKSDQTELWYGFLTITRIASGYGHILLLRGILPRAVEEVHVRSRTVFLAHHAYGSRYSLG